MAAQKWYFVPANIQTSFYTNNKSIYIFFVNSLYIVVVVVVVVVNSIILCMPGLLRFISNFGNLFLVVRFICLVDRIKCIINRSLHFFFSRSMATTYGKVKSESLDFMLIETTRRHFWKQKDISVAINLIVIFKSVSIVEILPAPWDNFTLSKTNFTICLNCQATSKGAPIQFHSLASSMWIIIWL